MIKDHTLLELNCSLWLQHADGGLAFWSAAMRTNPEDVKAMKETVHIGDSVMVPVDKTKLQQRLGTIRCMNATGFQWEPVIVKGKIPAYRRVG